MPSRGVSFRPAQRSAEACRRLRFSRGKSGRSGPSDARVPLPMGVGSALGPFGAVAPRRRYEPLQPRHRCCGGRRAWRGPERAPASAAFRARDRRRMGRGALRVGGAEQVQRRSAVSERAARRDARRRRPWPRGRRRHPASLRSLGEAAESARAARRPFPGWMAEQAPFRVDLPPLRRACRRGPACGGGTGGPASRSRRARPARGGGGAAVHGGGRV